MTAPDRHLPLLPSSLSMIITLLILLASSTFTYALYPLQISRRNTTSAVPPAGFYNPLTNGGALLTLVNGTFPLGQGEPLNIIISGNSDARVLADQQPDGGLINYFLSFGFSNECLGQHSGAPQQANLGDGNGYLNEISEIRWNYGDSQLGACKETIEGGDHFRYWIQSGPNGNSGAIFMASSYELPLANQHDIIVNGYNLGRDWIIGNITKTTIPTSNLTNGSTFSGTTSWANYTYTSQVTYVSGLLQNTSVGINHNSTVGVNGVPAIDGLVAVVDVKITGAPRTSFAWRPSPPHPWQLSSLLIILVISILLPASIVS